MYCNKCGATLEVNDKFCRACGTSTYAIKKVGEQNPWTASTPPPPPPSEQSVKTTLIEKPEENTIIVFIKKWASRILILVMAGMAAVIARPLGQMLTDKYQESKAWEGFSEGIEKAKKAMGLPKRIDEYTVANDMFITGKEIHYEYIVNDMKLDTDTKPEIKSIALESFNKALCNNIMITRYRGISVYTYKFPNGDITFHFTKSDCRL